jgi:transposase-like protein
VAVGVGDVHRSCLNKNQQKECLKGARAIYEAKNRRQAVRAYWLWASRWRQEAPKAVACLERDLDRLLNFLNCPAAHQRKVRTTNAIERCSTTTPVAKGSSMLSSAT